MIELVLAAIAAATVTVTMDVRPVGGEVRCALFVDDGAFPSEPERALQRVVATVQGGRATCIFTGVAKGRYAVSTIHDLNANGRMDTNFLGLPKEPWGTSRDASATFGPPSFSSAAFDVKDEPVSLSVRLRY